jgi:hypothetical protein
VRHGGQPRRRQVRHRRLRSHPGVRGQPGIKQLVRSACPPDPADRQTGQYQAPTPRQRLEPRGGSTYRDRKADGSQTPRLAHLACDRTLTHKKHTGASARLPRLMTCRCMPDTDAADLNDPRIAARASGGEAVPEQMFCSHELTNGY